MKEISTSTYTFEDLIKGGNLYVDKTQYFYRLVKPHKGQFFCARPRRFGKSLAISTLEAIFQGKRELFRGLAIDDMDYDWQKYPVLHLDFSGTDLTSKITMASSLARILKNYAKKYEVAIQEDSPANMFAELMENLYNITGKPVVLLIDEYDKPLLEHMNTPEEAFEWRNYIDTFYQMVKSSESLLRFVFITGVTKFAKVSIFSKLNNLNDITMKRDYAQMFGYTQEELEDNFKEYIDEAVREKNQGDQNPLLFRKKLLAEIQQWYDGFQFAEYGEKVYNPVSIGEFMSNHYEFNNYWFTTGTPGFLIKILQQNHLTLADVQDVIMSENSFNSFDVTELAGTKVSKEKLKQLLYQTGYLTLDKLFLQMPRIYRLRFPNKEVEDSFAEQLVYAYVGESAALGFVENLIVAAHAGNTEQIMNVIQSFFAGLPYDIQIPQEKYYQSIVFTIFKMCGMDIVTEERTNIGRIDAVLETEKHIYIIEFKFNQTRDTALNQICDKKYEEKYILLAQQKGQILHKLAINFSYEKGVRNITDWKEG